jgi:hypothetical protein
MMTEEEILSLEAAFRCINDAVFYSLVYRAVRIVETSVVTLKLANTEDKKTLLNVAVLSASIALLLKEKGFGD